MRAEKVTMSVQRANEKERKQNKTKQFIAAA